MTTLIAACLRSGDHGRDNWVAANQHAIDVSAAFTRDLREAKHLAPLLAAAQRRGTVRVDTALRTVLRIGLMRAELRSAAFRRVLVSVLATLNEARVRCALRGGVGAGATLYDSLGIRHTHAIDLLVRASDLSAAADAVPRTGCRLEESSDPAVRIMRHPTGVPVRISSSLSPWAHHDFGADALLERAEARQVAAVQAFVLSPADALLDLCASAFDARREDWPLWICDAWLLVQRRHGVDWSAILAAADAARLNVMVWGMLEFLATELAASVPDDVLRTLEARAAHSCALDRDVVLARGYAVVGCRGILRAIGGWRQRLPILVRLLVPSAAYMRHTRNISGNMSLPGHYVARIAAFAGRAIRHGVGRHRLAPVR